MRDNPSIQSIGPSPPESYGVVRRVVVVKEPSLLEVDGSEDTQFLFEGNETPPQRFSVDLSMSQLLDRSVDPLFRIDPRTDPIQIEIRNFSNYINKSAEPTLDRVEITRDGVPITYPAYEIWLDGIQTTLPADISDSLNFTLYPVPEPPWGSADTITITFVFQNEPPASLMTGTHVYDYRNATFPDPGQGILEVAVW
jgi:hypothetical protein